MKKPASAGFLLCFEEEQLLDLGFFIHHMLASNGIELLDLHFLRHSALVLGRGVEVTRTRAGFQFDFFTHDLFPYTFSPRARISARTASMPFLSMVRNAALVMRMLIQRFSLSTQNLRFCRLGRKRRFVLLFA